MSKILQLEKEYAQIGTIQDLSSIFEAIASIHLAKIKDKVVSSTTFFNELWHIYSQLRIDQKESIGRHAAARKGSFAVIAVTSDGGLSGDIDERVIRSLVKNEQARTADVFVIGGHGAGLLAQQGITTKQSFVLPDVEKNLDVGPMAKVISKYEKATLYYQQYLSLTRQEVAQIDLFTAVSGLGKVSLKQEGEVISSHDYLFEPSQHDIIAYMESVMLEIALGQVILESKLAQYASRFNAMSAAKNKAKDMRGDVNMSLHRAKRAVGDERNKEILSAMKLIGRDN